MIEVVFDTTKTDLEAIMTPWKADSLRYVWSKGGDVVTTKDLWEHIYPLYKISRTSLRQFLNRMAKAGVLENRPQTGKGGIHGRYSTKLDEEDFKGEVARTVLNKLLEFSPKATRQYFIRIYT